MSVKKSHNKITKREELVKELHPEDELRVEEIKLKREGSKLALKEAQEEEDEYNDERMTPEDDRYKQDLQDRKIEEGVEEGMIKGEKPEEVYDIEEAEELVEDDEIDANEEGFVRGYEEEEEEHFHKKKKKKDEEEEE